MSVLKEPTLLAVSTVYKMLIMTTLHKLCSFFNKCIS